MAAVFDQTNGNGDKVRSISTAEYFANAENLVSPHPVHSAFDLTKIEQAGYMPANWEKSPPPMSPRNLTSKEPMVKDNILAGGSGMRL